MSLQVLDLISSDNLNVPSEEEVYRAVLTWVKHDIDGRRQHVPWVSQDENASDFYSPRHPLLNHLCHVSPADEVRAAASAEARLPDEQRRYRAAGTSPLGVQRSADRGSEVPPDARAEGGPEQQPDTPPAL